MSKPPTFGIRDLLVSAGVGVFAANSGWSIAIGRMPDKPDTIIGLYDAPGQTPPEVPFGINYPVVEVRVRGSQNAYEAAFEKASDVRDALLALPPQTINGDLWASVTLARDPNHVGWDDVNRPIFSVTLQLIVHQGDLSNSYRVSA